MINLREKNARERERESEKNDDDDDDLSNSFPPSDSVFAQCSE
jgi:hypothetical protein